MRGVWAMLCVVALAASGCCTSYRVVEQAPANPFHAAPGFEVEPLDDPALDAAVREGFAYGPRVAMCKGCGYRVDIAVTALVLPDDRLGSDSLLQAMVTIRDPTGAADVVRFEPRLAPKHNWAPAERRIRLLGNDLGRLIAFYLVRRASGRVGS